MEEGILLKNDAAIYFDFNEPIITNEVCNEIKKETSTHIANFKKEVFDFRLYPNPANEIVFVSFSLPETMWVELRVHNKLGQETGTAFGKKRLPKGQHTIPLNNYFFDKNTPAGVYWISLCGDETIVTEKLVFFGN